MENLPWFPGVPAQPFGGVLSFPAPSIPDKNHPPIVRKSFMKSYESIFLPGRSRHSTGAVLGMSKVETGLGRGYLTIQW